MVCCYLFPHIKDLFEFTDDLWLRFCYQASFCEQDYHIEKSQCVGSL
jgi:hypothetical protein